MAFVATDWTGEKSVKERFPIKEKNVNAYCAGEFTMDKAIEKMRERGQKSEEALANLAQLSQEVQKTMLDMNLKPTLRTFCTISFGPRIASSTFLTRAVNHRQPHRLPAARRRARPHFPRHGAHHGARGQPGRQAALGRQLAPQ